MTAKNIDEVLAHLDEIVEWATRTKNRQGYFAILYREVTREVKKGIQAGRFEDGPRMEQLDVVFANRYLEAWDQYHHKERCSASWRIAFNATRNANLLVLQQLLLGMNAHIHLDLGIAAARVCPGECLPELKDDFYEINELLGEMINKVQKRLGRVSPALRVFDWFSGNLDEKLAEFGLERSRATAWKLAEDLAFAEKPEEIIRKADQKTALKAKLITNPGFRLKALLGLARITEPIRVTTVIRALDEE
ncbi:MAG: DUF5995 family protein [Bacteroidota bacterium]